jgi:hypothetical protein
MDLMESWGSDKKTLYTVTDEHGEKSTITIDKFTADILQAHLSNVHAWIQDSYDRVALKKPGLTRREQGDHVRALAAREATTTQLYKSFMDELL